MRLGILAIVSGVALSLSAAAYASEAQPGATAQPVSAVNDDQKIVCHYITHEGMLLAKPVCATQYAWDKERRRQQQEIADYQLRAVSVPMK